MTVRGLTLLKNAGAAIALIFSQVLTSGQLLAAPHFTDARALAMGGVGVTAARPAAASFYNPALLAVKQKTKSDGFGMLLPSVSVVANDEHELIDTVDDFDTDFLDPFENSLDDLDQAITGLGTTSTITDVNNALSALEANTNKLDGELVRIDRDQAIIDVGLGVSFQVPGEDLGVGFFASSAARIGAALEYRDSQLLQDTIQDARDAVTGLNPSLITYTEGDLQASVRAVGVANSEVGLSFAHNFDIAGHHYAIGVSPKLVNYRVYDISYDVDGFDDIDEQLLEDSKESKTAFNFDIGIASYLDRDNRWLVGFSVLNVIPQDLKTKDSQVVGGSIQVTGVTVDMEPVATAGISYAGDSYIVAADLQLTQVKATFTEDDQQYIGIGAEYDLFESAQFRIGTRYNLAGSSDPIITTGIGVTALGASFELAALGSTDANTLGLSLQIGSTF